MEEKIIIDEYPFTDTGRSWESILEKYSLEDNWISKNSLCKLIVSKLDKNLSPKRELDRLEKTRRRFFIYDIENGPIRLLLKNNGLNEYDWLREELRTRNRFIIGANYRKSYYAEFFIFRTLND